MTTEYTNPESQAASETSDKPKRTRKPMDAARKQDHHTARELLTSYFSANSAMKEKWTKLFTGADGKVRQVRVISNLLLDYVPSFLKAFSSTPDAAMVAACEAVLTNAATDPAAYRKANKPLNLAKPA
jgi:hypothetical protein